MFYIEFFCCYKLEEENEIKEMEEWLKKQELGEFPVSHY